MPHSNLHPTSRSLTTRRVLLLIAASVAGLLSIGLLTAGGFVLWGNGEKDSDGFISTNNDRYETRSYAVASDDLDVDLGAPGWTVGSNGLGEIRLKATSNTDKPVFVGIAPTREVSAYLCGSAHATVTDLDYLPFRARYRDHVGDRSPELPTEQTFWSASAHGAGSPTATWKVQDGSWSIVVMNADGSRGLDAGVSVGASVPFLAPLGWTLIGGGLFLLVVAAGAGYLGLRPSGGSPRRVGAVQPATAG